MSFWEGLKSALKKIGGSVLKVLPLAGPIVQSLAQGSNNPVFASIAQAILTAQVTAEAVGQAANTEGKLAAVLPLAKEAILQLEFLKGKEIADEERFDKGVRAIVEGVFDVQKSFKE